MERPKVVLITGATTGIGRETALHLARLGYDVLATGRKAAALDELRREADGLRLDTFVLDVNDAASIAAAGVEVDRRTEGRGLDALVNNAGFGLMGPMELVTEEDLRAQFETNVFGLVRVTQRFAPAMRRRGEGCVVNVSSVVGLLTVPLQGVYCATKHAVEALTDAMRMELGPFGVRVVLVEPGSIRTQFATTIKATVDRYRAMESPYGPAFDRYQRQLDQVDRTSPGPEVVARTIAKVLRKRRPRARYLSPGRYRVAIWALRLLPTRWFDRTLKGAMGLTRKALADPAGRRR
ncbi:MAG: SDR family oxidoreductase [Deltaproteobacteria bacterium]|nr:SDR family oxidoreductase [Deltaproteobacteria bacterium]